MGISHGACNHPRTPAGRAACRRAGRPAVKTQQDVVENGYPANKPTMGGARFQVRGPHGAAGPSKWTVVDTHDRNIAVHTARTKADAIESARELNAQPHQTTMVPNSRIRRTTPDPFAGMPDEFRTAVTHLTDMEVRTGDPHNDHERRVVIESVHGRLDLVWKIAPHEGHGAFWRPRNSSITSKLMSVNVGIELLKGDQ